jgi:hypothetical protein
MKRMSAELVFDDSVRMLRPVFIRICLALLIVIVSTICEARQLQDGPQAAEGTQSQSLSNKRPTLHQPEISQFLSDVANDPRTMDDPLLGKQRVALDKQNRSLQFNLAHFPSGSILSEDDPLSEPLEAAIRLRALRRDLSVAFPDDATWEPLINATSQAIYDCVNTSANSATVPPLNTVSDPCPTIEVSFGRFARKLREYAKIHKLDLVESRGATSLFPVKITFDPKSVKLKIMTALQYRECMFFHLQEDQFFSDVLQTDQSLVGRYHYRAEWPHDLGGPDEGDFEIKGPATLKFSPGGK